MGENKLGQRLELSTTLMLGGAIAGGLAVVGFAWANDWHDKWIFTAVFAFFSVASVYLRVVEKFPKAEVWFSYLGRFALVLFFGVVALGLLSKGCNGRLGECVPNRFDDCT